MNNFEEGQPTQSITFQVCSDTLSLQNFTLNVLAKELTVVFVDLLPMFTTSQGIVTSVTFCSEVSFSISNVEALEENGNFEASMISFLNGQMAISKGILGKYNLDLEISLHNSE